MSLGFVGSVLAGMLGIAFLYVLVSHSQTATIINAGGTQFANGLHAAMGAGAGA